MENQRKLLLSGKTIQCPKELANHPVFKVNQKTNKIIAQRRSKVNATFSFLLITFFIIYNYLLIIKYIQLNNIFICIYS